MINELNFSEVALNSINTSSDKSITNLIISELFRIILFGIPLIIGLFLIYNTDKNDINKLASKNYNVA
jgi:ABC-type arginine/histidine transport system permease subunit